MFAREMEGVIQNYLLLRRATEAGSRAWALSGLQSLMQSLTSPFSLPDVLEKIARNALLTLDADNVAVYQYHADRNDFYVPPVLDGHFMDTASMKTDLSPDDTPFEFVKRAVSQFIVDVHKHKDPEMAAPGKNGKMRFVEREKVKSCAVLVLRAGEGGEIVGLLFVNFRRFHNFSGEEKRAMYALATSAALAIRNARLHKDDLKGQLQAMHEVLAAIAEKGPDLTQVLERLLQQTLDMTGAKYGVCMRWNEHAQVLEPVARWPAREDYPIEPQTIEEGIVGLAAKSRKSILVEDVEDHNKSMFVETVGDFCPAKIYKKVNPDTRCEIAVPLLDEGRLLGVLNIEHPEPHGLTQDDRVLWQTLAVPAIIAFHTVDLYKRLERRIRHRKALNLVAVRVQEKPYELDTILRLFLTGITAGDGLGFSRAMLFLADEGGRTLRGQSALGAVTRLEAEKVWQELEQSDRILTGDLNSLLGQAEQFSDDVREGRVVDYPPLSSKLREISINIEDATGAVARCLESGKSVTVAFDEPDPLRDTIRELTEPDDLWHAIACVPLIGKQKKQIGVLVVDNRFLLQERAIDADDIAGLEAFADLLALSIENARLQEKLVEEQRVEAWKEITADIAHSVGTRVSVIKGAVTRLEAVLKVLALGHATAEIQRFLERLNAGITKAERLLQEFRTFAIPSPLRQEDLDLRSVLTDVCHDAHDAYQIVLELPEDPVPVFADSFKLDNALMEILKNAHEAMSGMIHRPHLIWISLTTEQTRTTSPKYAQIDIIDNGSGIADEVKGKLLEPFVTTKTDGTGLGLAIANSVIRGHGGTLQSDNCPGRGARFVIRLPMFATPLDLNSGEANG